MLQIHSDYLSYEHPSQNQVD